MEEAADLDAWTWAGILCAMDDRNLVAVAEQAAATARVQRSPIAGCTVLADDGRVFLGCLIEYSDPALSQDPIANGIAAGRRSLLRLCPVGARHCARLSRGRSHVCAQSARFDGARLSHMWFAAGRHCPARQTARRNVAQCALCCGARAAER